MSSFPDSDIATRTDAPTRPSTPEDILARVKSDGLRRRNRRHRRNAVLAAFGLAIIAVPAIALLPDGDGDEDLNVATEVDQPSTTAERRPTTTAPPTTRVSATTAITTATTLAAPTLTVVVLDEEATEAASPATTTPPRRTPRTTVPPASPTTELAPPTTAVCRNSTEPSCGDFRWDPEPSPNEPLSATMTASNAAPTAGEVVTFTVSWSDPDADLRFEQIAVDGDAGLAQPCSSENRHGPWTPPDRAGGSGQLTYERTFDTPGDHVVSVGLATADCNSPYGSERTVQMVVSVQAPPPAA